MQNNCVIQSGLILSAFPEVFMYDLTTNLIWHFVTQQRRSLVNAEKTLSLTIVAAVNAASSVPALRGGEFKLA